MEELLAELVWRGIRLQARGDRLLAGRVAGHRLDVRSKQAHVCVRAG